LSAFFFKEGEVVSLENELVNKPLITSRIVSASPGKGLAVLALPLVALGILGAEHNLLGNAQPFFNGQPFKVFLIVLLGIYVVLAAASWLLPVIKKALLDKAPLLAAAILAVTVWDLITLKFALLPLPYFPSPAAVLAALFNERNTLIISALYSLRLLFTGYFIGLAVGLPTGVIMGWSPRFHYWINPLLRLIGPIPATAWIPLAMVVFPTSFTASIFLIALSCWFPITVMTWSGIANVNKSYYEVARSLGASEWYLISRVALPAAMPTIFVGLFMGLGMAFVTLIVGEMLGVKAGLGWFITWAQGWAEYTKVYAALIVMSLIFSTVITLLFRIRDRVLAWQRGLIKW
jgi:NitT/TauT family transport system permease protein